jgi:hypothetical protein
MPTEDASEFIAAMKAEFGVKLDQELAGRLGIDPSAVAAWRRRKKVPDKYRVRFLRIMDEYAVEESLAPNYWLLLDGYVFALVGLAARRLAETVTILKDDDYQEMWHGFRLHRLYSFAHRTLHSVKDYDKDKLRKVYEQIRAKIDSDDLHLWIETLPGPGF